MEVFGNDSEDCEGNHDCKHQYSYVVVNFSRFSLFVDEEHIKRVRKED